ncbi:uncharacterized protein LOC131953331 [Physella acuta]|uniref:uncharacterized protein LOC131953331 n=1 Tax=Physella acuta TaxID=109671 RepID=UPI0027DB4D65|nr:uncharacterized protein LOC131953331 [Physella acuta]XP_059172460.1 uncharacterized protein LOC131953331 [Physella acuta]
MEGLSSEENSFCVAAEDMIDTNLLDRTSHTVPKSLLLEQCSAADIEMALSEVKQLGTEDNELLTVSQPMEHNYFITKSQGLEVGKYDTLLDCFMELTDPVLNGYIVRSMQISTVKSANFKCRQIAQKLDLFDINNLLVFQRFRNAIVKLLKNVQLLRKQLKTNWSRLVECLNTPFTFNIVGRVKSTVTSVIPTEDLITSNLELVVVQVNTSGKEISSTQEDDTSVSEEGMRNTSPLGVPGFSSADKQMTDEKSKRSIRAKHRLWLKTNSCSRCHMSNQALLKSKNKIRDLRKICRTQQSPKIESLQQALTNKSMEVEKLKLKIKSLEIKLKYKLKSESKSDLTLSFLEKEKGEQPTTSTQEELRVLKIMHTKLQNKMQLFKEINEKNLLAFSTKLKSNHIEIEQLKAEIKKLVEENNTLNDKLSTELIFQPFDSTE